MAASTANIQEHMEVVCSTGGHVGTVDHVDGVRIKLTRKDSKDGQHHYLSRAYVAAVDDKVHLALTGDLLKAQMQTE